MKHLIRLLLAVCCLAFVQAEPVAALATDAGGCSCCDCGGACGMPDCAPAPAARAPVLSLEGTRAVQTQKLRRSEESRRHADPYTPALGMPPLPLAARIADRELHFDSGPPGFVRQCRLLI